MVGNLFAEPPVIIVTVFLICLLMAALIVTFCCRRIRTGECRQNENKYSLLKNNFISLNTTQGRVQPLSDNRIKVKLVSNVYQKQNRKNTIRYGDCVGEAYSKNTYTTNSLYSNQDHDINSKKLLSKSDNLRKIGRKTNVGDRIPRPDSCLDSDLGRVTFTLRYSKPDEFLIVHLISGRNIYSKDLSYEIRLPVISVQIEGQIETEVTSNPDEAPNPEYDQEFTFSLQEHELYGTRLKFTVWDIVSNNETRVIGFFRVDLTHFCGDLLRDGETGTISQDIKNTLTEKTEELGEILVSLFYDCVTDKIKVAILRVKNLALKEDDKDIYIKISYLLDNKTIQSKRTTTLPPHDSLYINTTFEFNALSNDLDQVSTDSSTAQQVVTEELLSNARTSLTTPVGLYINNNIQHWSTSSSGVSDTLRNNMGVLISVRTTTSNSNKRVAGRLYIGKTQTPCKDEDVHWTEMIKNFDNTITQWHHLKLESF